jgi:hypothetical protein
MRAIRWFIIRIAEIFILLIVVLATLVSAVSGYYAIQLMELQAMSTGLPPVAGAVIGGILGFVSMAIVSAIFFLLVEIANNTRRTVSFFQHVVDRNNGD